MRTALVFATLASDVALVEEAIGSSGWQVRGVGLGDIADVTQDKADVIVADVGAGTHAGWLRVFDPAIPPAPLVVMSRFLAFLSDLPPSVSAVIHLPATNDTVLAAVESAWSEHAPGSPPFALEKVVAALAEKKPPGATLVSSSSREAAVASRNNTSATLSANREEALSSRGLLSGPPDPELSSIAELVTRGLGVESGVVAAVGREWQHYLGHAGLPPDIAAAGGTKRAWSFCQHTVQASSPLIIEDARTHPGVHENPFVTMGLVAAYAGVPIELEGVGTIGTVCAFSARPRGFSEAEMATLTMAARLAGQILSTRPQRPERKSQPRVEPSSPQPVAPPSPRARGLDEAGPRAAPTLDSAMPYQPLGFAVGDLVDSYWITATLGKGGQGKVYLARDKNFGRLVAIKVTAPELERSLIREGQAIANLRHANIVQLHGLGRAPNGSSYLVLEYVAGETIETRLARARAVGERLPIRLVCDVVRQMAGALATMHAHGFVHGDIKPDNVMLDSALDRAVLIDFGLGFVVPTRGAPPPSIILGGTVGFSAPEQLANAGAFEAAPSLDVYGLGALAFTMLTGVAPFDGSGSALMRQLRDDPRKLADLRQDLPAELGTILASALSSDPARRPTSTIALSDAMWRAIGGAQTPSISPERFGVPGLSGSPRKGATVAQSRAAVFPTLRTDVARELGADVEARVFAATDPATQVIFENAAIDDDASYQPAWALVSYLKELAKQEPRRIADLRFGSAGDALRRALRVLRVNPTPEAILATTSSLFDRFHTWGVVQTERTDASDGRLLLTMPDGFAPYLCAYLGATLRALLTTTDRNAKLVETSCRADGSPRCVFDVAWSSS